jgi:AcrR family transcriptional regulator
LPPRREARGAKPGTEAVILKAAERLFALHGVEAVSLRQIASEAGSSNNFVVQYHFDSKAGLVHAIFERRLQSIEARRAQLLAEATRSNRLQDPRALIEILIRPPMEEKDEDGRHTYAAFLIGMRHFEGVFMPSKEGERLAPVRTHVSDLLTVAVPGVPEALLRSRVVCAATMFLSAFTEWDRLRAEGQPTLLDEQALIREQLDIATAAVLAPVAPEVLEALGAKSSAAVTAG